MENKTKLDPKEFPVTHDFLIVCMSTYIVWNTIKVETFLHKYVHGWRSNDGKQLRVFVCEGMDLRAN